MANLKKITELPVVDSTEGLNLIVNDNGEAKQIAADAVGKVKTVNGVEPDANGNVEVRTQPDWNQNDPTAPDYVKNRPFWTDDLVETVFCDVTVTIIDYVAEIPCPNFIEGLEYVVIFDGVEYKETARVLEEGVCYIGSGFPFTGEYVDGDAPFCMVEGSMMTVYPDGEHTVKIIGAIQTVNKIEKKYLPDNISYKSELPDYELIPVSISRFCRDIFGISAISGGTDPTTEIEVDPNDWEYFCNAMSLNNILWFDGNMPVRALTYKDVRDGIVTYVCDLSTFSVGYGFNEYKTKMRYSYDTRTMAVTYTNTHISQIL